VTDTVTWRTLLEDATARLRDASDARRIVESASGYSVPEGLERSATQRTLAHFDAMVERRASGEPLQYVLGSWGFRHLDVMVDRRVLIPRPEAEVVVEHALHLIDELDASTVVDLGTGSGVIALSIAHERRGVDVWATDASAPALDVARANLAGIGRAGTRVTLAAGSWFTALPEALRGQIDLVVSNPPYIAEDEVLPAEVSEWEPHDALIAGASGLEAITAILYEAPAWIRPHGAVVLEIGETQADAARDAATGFDEVRIEPDLAGRPRVLIAIRR
jgi:release factor glutamine methyltransferase